MLSLEDRDVYVHHLSYVGEVESLTHRAKGVNDVSAAIGCISGKYMNLSLSLVSS